MRNTTWLKYIMWVVVISFMGAIFFIWGRAGDSDSTSRTTLFGGEYAVYVDGKTQSPGILKMRFRQQEEQYRQMLGANYKPEFMRGACTRLANSMADELILEEMSAKYGLSVGDQEVADTIQRIYNFEDPRVDYPEMLSRLGVSAADYQDLVRRSLLLQKLRALLQDTAYFSDKELLDLYIVQNDRYKASVAAVTNASFRTKVAPPTEADLKAAFEREKAKLTTPEKRTIKYVLIEEAGIRKKVAVDEVQLRSYYDSHKDQFSLNASQRRASHILFKVAPDAKAPDLDAAKKKAQEMVDRAKKGEDFAQLAQKNSQDSSAANGGDLGWFGRESMVKPFADGVFDQCKTAGDIAGPIQSQFGFHVIKLTGIGGQVQPFGEVREKVRQAVLQGDPSLSTQVKSLTEKASEELKNAKNDGDIEKFAKAWDVLVTPITDPFTDKTPLLNLGMDPKLMKAVFGAKKDEWAPVMDFRRGFLRFSVTSVTPAHPSSFEEAKGQLQMKVLDDRASALAQETAKELAAATGLDDLKKRATAAGITVTESGSIRMEDAIPGIGADKTVAKALMGAELNTVVGPLKAKSGFVVAVVTERTTVDAAKFATAKDQFLKQQRSSEASRLVDDYVAQRRREIEPKNLIRLNEELIKSLEPKTPERPERQG
jgi:peptidyl-prolyl cis-trans isomerase D